MYVCMTMEVQNSPRKVFIQSPCLSPRSQNNLSFFEAQSHFATCLQLFRSFLIGPKRRPDVSAFGFGCSKEKFFACHAKNLVCAPLIRRRCTAVATLLPGRPHRAAVGTDRTAPPLPLRRLRCAAAVTAAAAPLSEPTVLRRCRG